MAYKIGFVKENDERKVAELKNDVIKKDVAVGKSVVRVYFPDRNQAYSYYNDQFDLQVGDLVYVEGKLQGIRGRVTDVQYNFKIKISDYKRVIAVADTDVKGDFYLAGSHFVSFDAKALPKDKVSTWFRAPMQDEEYVSGYDDATFSLDQLSDMNVSKSVAERGHEYYVNNQVRYICIDGNRGYALVEGSETYEVEFEYRDREISNLVCSCFCSFNCKHEFAAMLQLRETLDIIEKHYQEEYKGTGYFAAIHKATLFNFVIEGKEKGKFTL